MWRAEVDRDGDAPAVRLLIRAGRFRQAGPYQLQAAIVACHAEASSWDSTDWNQVVLLYDELLRLAPTPVTRLNRAIALRYVAGPAASLAEIEPLTTELRRYRLLHATRAQLLTELGRHGEAKRANQLALTLTTNPAERALLERLA